MTLLIKPEGKRLVKFVDRTFHHKYQATFIPRSGLSRNGTPQSAAERKTTLGQGTGPSYRRKRLCKARCRRLSRNHGGGRPRASASARLPAVIETDAPRLPGLLGLDRDALSNSPTLTSPALASHADIVLGTAAYMSPELAEGRPVDKGA
jgi:hypothetical protein